MASVKNRGFGFINVAIFFIFVNQFAASYIIRPRLNSSNPCQDNDLGCESGGARTIILHGKQIKSRRHTCIVGAGIAGMSTARRLLEVGEEFSVFEATAHVGGTWRYDPHVGTDAHGRPVHSSMYKHLRTNLPKKLMELPGFPMPKNATEFPSSAEYYNYLLTFAEHFELKKHIKFLHEVTSIIRSGGHWRLKYQNVIRRREIGESLCDYVIMCNGHFNKPRMPNISGEDTFKGTIIHSHDFRDPDLYQNRRVLIVGAGPSGMDIGHLLSMNSSRLVHSHHSDYLSDERLPANYALKPDVEEFTEHGVRFKDNSYEEIDDVVFCTGYEESYPFLDEPTGLSIENGKISPLYRGFVNINHPTMLLLGIQTGAIDLDEQAQYARAIITGRTRLPSGTEMRREWQLQHRYRRQGRHRRSIHANLAHEMAFYANVTAEAGMSPKPPVIRAIREAVIESALQNYGTFRDYEYTVVDDHKFTRRYRPDGRSERFHA